jgi:hypothetical protein
MSEEDAFIAPFGTILLASHDNVADLVRFAAQFFGLVPAMHGEKMTYRDALKLLQEVQVFVGTFFEFTWEKVFHLVGWLEADLEWVLFVFLVVTVLVFLTPFLEANGGDPLRCFET